MGSSVSVESSNFIRVKYLYMGQVSLRGSCIFMGSSVFIEPSVFLWVMCLYEAKCFYVDQALLCGPSILIPSV